MKTNSQFNFAILGLTLLIFLAFNSRAQLNWVKYGDNPVMEGIPEAWNLRLFEPVVIHEDGLFKMWYMGQDDFNNATIWQIGYADSPDGINWNIYDNPAIPAGEPGSMDYLRCPGAVLRVNDTLKMWWWGGDDAWSGLGRIYYAWFDEITGEWNLLDEPVLVKGDDGEWDDYAVIYPQVYYDGTMYHMYYSGVGGEPGIDIGYATSANGIDWEKDYFWNPVMYHGTGTEFYNQWITSYGMVFYNDTLRMFFNGMHSDWTHYRVGYAWSTNYVIWNIGNDSEPVVNIGEPGEWDDEWVRMPTVLVHDGQLKMWYTGKQAGNPSLKIGYACEFIDGMHNKYELYNNTLRVSPSPITNQATFSFELHEKSMVQLDVYNLNGLLVSTLVNEVRTQGKHEVFFNGEYLQPGIYFCILKTDLGIQTKKIIKLK